MLTIPELGEESLSYVFACVCLLLFSFSLSFFPLLIKETPVNLLAQLAGWHKIDGEADARLALGGNCALGGCGMPFFAKLGTSPSVAEQTEEAGRR